MTVGGVVASLITGALGVTAGYALGRGRRRARLHAAAAELRRSVDPYLRRKAAEAGIEVAPPAPLALASPAAVLREAGALAERLLDHERGELPGAAAGGSAGDRYRAAVAETQEMDAKLVARAHVTAPERPAAKRNT